MVTRFLAATAVRRGSVSGLWSSPGSRWGRPGTPTAYTPVRPAVVVEVTVDTAVEHHRWRHPARFLRVRADLRSGDLIPLPPIPASPLEPRRVQAG